MADGERMRGIPEGSMRPTTFAVGVYTALELSKNQVDELISGAIKNIYESAQTLKVREIGVYIRYSLDEAPSPIGPTRHFRRKGTADIPSASIDELLEADTVALDRDESKTIDLKSNILYHYEPMSDPMVVKLMAAMAQRATQGKK